MKVKYLVTATTLSVALLSGVASEKGSDRAEVRLFSPRVRFPRSPLRPCRGFTTRERRMTLNKLCCYFGLHQCDGL
jgi:hypothetical protein